MELEGRSGEGIWAKLGGGKMKDDMINTFHTCMKLSNNMYFKKLIAKLPTISFLKNHHKT